MIKKRLLKKSTGLIIIGVLTVAMTAVVLAAPRRPGGNGNTEGNGNMGSTGGKGSMQEIQGGFGENMPSLDDSDRPELSDGEGFTGERPELPDGAEPTGDRPELPDGEGPAGERPELPDGVEPTGDRPELPDGEEAAGERPELPDGEKCGQRGDRNGRGGMKEINTEDINTAIEALEDEEVKADLKALLSDYENAKEALKTAIENAAEDIDTYRKAEIESMKALREALDEAGIDTRPELAEEEGNQKELSEDEAQGNRPAMQRGQDDGGRQQTGVNTEKAGNDTEKQGMPENSANADGKASTDSILERITGWFKSLFSR